jgi:hypothetical protein
MITAYSAGDALRLGAAEASCTNCGAALPPDRSATDPIGERGEWAVLCQPDHETDRKRRATFARLGVAVLCGVCAGAVRDALEARRARS